MSLAATDAPRIPWRGTFARVLPLVFALLAWELAARALEGSYILAGPLDVLVYAQAHTGLLWRALLATFSAAAQGFLWGNLAAILLAACALLVPAMERPIRLVGLVVFCLPLVAIGPILRVLYGPGDGPQITLAALAVFYTTLIPLLVGMRAMPQVWLDLVESYGRGRWTALTHIRARASVPYLVVGLQIAAPAAFLAAMIGEFTGAERGLGVLTLRALRALDVDATWTLAVVATLVSILAYAAAGWLGRRLAFGSPPVLLSAAAPRAGAATVWPTLLTLLFVVLAWHVAMEALGLNPFFAKRPGDVWAYLVTSTEAAAHRAQLLGALAQTMATTLPGYAAGLITGLVLAILCVQVPAFRSAVLPLAIALRSAPIVTTAPLIVFVVGRGPVGTVTLVAVMIFFPTLIACLEGLRQAPGRIVDVFESYGARRRDLLIYVRLPAMLPAFFASARMTVPAAVLAATVSEWLATGAGIGNLMALSSSTSNYNMLWSCVLVLTAVSVALHGAVAWVETRVLTQYAPEQLRR